MAKPLASTSLPFKGSLKNLRAFLIADLIVRRMFKGVAGLLEWIWYITPMTWVN